MQNQNEIIDKYPYPYHKNIMKERVSSKSPAYTFTETDALKYYLSNSYTDRLNKLVSQTIQRLPLEKEFNLDNVPIIQNSRFEK